MMDKDLLNGQGSAMNAPRINPKDLPWVECGKGIQVFETGYLFKKLSALLSPSGKEEMIPAEVVICKNCKKIPKFVWDKMPDVPEEMKSDCE